VVGSVSGRTLPRKFVRVYAVRVTLWSRVLLGNVVVVKLKEKFLTLCSTLKFIADFTRVYQGILF
jgi:hypothetical protein